MSTATETPSNGIAHDETPVASNKGNAGALTSTLTSATDASEWQWLFSPADLQHTPSVLQSGLTPQEERSSRWKGAQLIFRIGDYMRLGNHVTATATTFFHRFYMRKSLPGERGLSSSSSSQGSYPYQEMAPTCIFLACKVEETHRKLHGIIEATMAMMDRTSEGQQRSDARMYRVDINSQDYRRWKTIVLLREERLLAALCFDLIVDQPHPAAIKACRLLLGPDRELARLTILLLNCLLHGAICTFFDAATLAATAFAKACQYIDVNPRSLSPQRPWSDAFDVDQDEVDEAMPIVDEFLEYHHGKVQQQLRAEPQLLSTSGTKSSKPNTPMPSQHISLDHGKALAHASADAEDAESRYDGTPHRGSKRAHFAQGEDDGAMTDRSALTGGGGSSRHWVSPRVGSSQGGTTGPHVTPRAPDWSDREEVTTSAPARPISRRGAREGHAGPPPPLASRLSGHASAAPSSRDSYTMQSPEKTRDDVWRPTMERHSSAPRRSPHDARGPASHRDEVHQKVAHEQAQQERHVLLSPKMHSPTKPRATGYESDEEGAL